MALVAAAQASQDRGDEAVEPRESEDQRVRRRTALDAIGLAFLGGLTACGDGPPTGPTPPPDPDPTPTPEPSPTPGLWPRLSFPIRVSGTQFSGGWRWGAWDVYGPGWTLPQQATLQRLADAGVNWVGVRLGPQEPGGPDGMHAPPALWSALDNTLGVAFELGLAVEVALFDAWVIQHGYSYYPWSMDIAHRPPDRSQLDWIREAASHLRSHSNVVLLDGNEMFKLLRRPYQPQEPGDAWSKAILREIRRELPGVVVGTNAERADVERLFDFVTIHQDTAVGIQARKPTGVNEAGPMQTPQSWARESQAARRLGTFFDLWRGDMEDDQWSEALRLHAEVRRASGR